MKKDKYKIDEYSLEHIRNHNEVEVIKAMKKVLSQNSDFCGCSLCLEDVYALSLNMLPAKYKQSSSIMLTKDKVPAAKIESVVVQAIEKVSGHPSHGCS
ncbi:late competence development ComFB family protein [candidate division KSB1 bacterium]